MVAAKADGPSSRTSPIWPAAPVSAWTAVRVSRVAVGGQFTGAQAGPIQQPVAFPARGISS
jgi:hypothetical protein